MARMRYTHRVYGIRCSIAEVVGDCAIVYGECNFSGVVRLTDLEAL